MDLTRHEKSQLRSLGTRQGRKHAPDLCRCEGLRAVRDLLTCRPDLVELTVATERGIASLAPLEAKNLRRVGEAEFSEFSATVNHQGIMALAKVPPESSAPPRGDFILALDQVSDPGNFGTIVRTFRAIGGKDIWYTKGSVDPWGDKCIRSGMGAQFFLDWRRFDDLNKLAKIAAEQGYGKLFLTDPHAGENCFTSPDLFDHSVLVIGGEANGFSQVPENSRHVMIPMPGDYESLNAAQAATVFLLEYVRRNIHE